MPFKILRTDRGYGANFDVATGSGMASRDLLPFKDIPTSYLDQNLFRNPSPSTGDEFGKKVVVKGGHLYCADPDNGQLWAWEIWEANGVNGDSITNPRLTGNNANFTSNYIADWQYNVSNTFSDFAVGYNRVVGIREKGLSNIGYHFEASVDKSSIISNSFIANNVATGVAIGNGRLYLGHADGFEIYKFADALDFVTDPIHVKYVQGTTVSGPYNLGVGGGVNAIAAKHGLVAYVNEGRNYLELYTADGLKIRSLIKESDGINLGDASVAIGCGRIVVGAPYQTSTGSVYIYNYAGKLIKTFTGSDSPAYAHDRLGWDVAVGNDIIVASDPNGEADRNIAIYPSNHGLAIAMDLNGNRLEDYGAYEAQGTGGQFWYFSLLESGDNYGWSVDISDGFFAVGILNEDVNSNNYAGGSVVYRLPQTIGEHYDKILETFRYL